MNKLFVCMYWLLNFCKLTSLCCQCCKMKQKSKEGNVFQPWFPRRWQINATYSKNPQLFICFTILRYSVSHGKVNKVILLCWGYIFRFLLIFWTLHIHEKRAFTHHSSVFIEMMMHTIFFETKSLNLPFVKLFSKNFF